MSTKSMLANASSMDSNAGFNRHQVGNFIQRNFPQSPLNGSVAPKSNECRVFTISSSPSPDNRDDVAPKNNFTHVKEATIQKRTAENASPTIKGECTSRRGRKRLRVTLDLRRLRLKPARTPTVRVNHGFCDICRQSGMDELVCCDRCPRSYHPSCIYMPISVLDRVEWFCEHCTIEMKAGHLEKICGISQIMFIINSQGPVEFCLPKEILSLAVYASAKGIGVNMHAPEKENSMLFAYRGLRDMHVTNEDQAIGECCKCGSQANPDQLLHCGLCPLSWHQYCLSVPVIYPNGKMDKWMCPNHPEHLQPRRSPLGQYNIPNTKRYHHATPSDETQQSLRIALNCEGNDRRRMSITEHELGNSATPVGTHKVSKKNFKEKDEQASHLLSCGDYGRTEVATLINRPASSDHMTDVSHQTPVGIAREIHARRSSSGSYAGDSSYNEEKPLMMYDLREPVDLVANLMCETDRLIDTRSAHHAETDEDAVGSDVYKLYRVPERIVQSTFVRAVKRLRKDETYAVAKKYVENDESMRDLNEWCNSLKELKSVIDWELASNTNDDKMHHDALLRVIIDNAIESSTEMNITQSDYTAFLAFKRLTELRKDGKISFPPEFP